ncbi:MAG: tol-pal system YbgF family protein [Bacteroidia bacterium]
MKKLISLLLVLILCSCGEKEQVVQQVSAPDTTENKGAYTEIRPSDCGFALKEVMTIDSILMQHTELNQEMANKAIKKFADYAYYCESDSLSPVYLIKVAQIALAINNPNQAKVVLEKCIDNYPKFNNRPVALFLMAQLYHEPKWLNNPDEARKWYQKIIDDFPKTDWSVNAQAAMQLIGKSDEQIIREFEKKNSKK